MLDADEILTFPGCEHTSVRELCNALDRAGKRAMSGVMIDMYGAGSIAETRYVPGDDFLDHCRYFDRRTHHQSVENAGPFSNQTFRFGGARTRVFGSEVDYLVTKTPLIRYEPDVVLAGGQHWTSHPSERIAHDGCAVLHFKYFSSLVDRATAEAERAESSQWRQQIESYRATLDRDRDLRLYDPSRIDRVRGQHAARGARDRRRSVARRQATPIRAPDCAPSVGVGPCREAVVVGDAHRLRPAPHPGAGTSQRARAGAPRHADRRRRGSA